MLWGMMPFRRRRPIVPRAPRGGRALFRWEGRRQGFDGVCAADTSAAAAAAAAAITTFGALLAGHVLRDGELVLLIQRPSKWYILLTSLKFLAAVGILISLAVIFDDRLHHTSRQWVEAGVFLMAGRVMWAVLAWMGRLYILTDLRIIRLAGVFTVDIFDCPLRKVARTLLESSFKEQVVRVGSIIIIPQEEDYPIGAWTMVARPREVHEQIVATINRAKQGSHSLR
jgi:hypothetical protein